MRLHIGILCTEKFFDAVDCKLFGLIDYLTAAIITMAGIAFGIFVCEARTHGFHHLVADEILRRDQLDAFFLAFVFTFDDVENLIVSFHCA